MVTAINYGQKIHLSSQLFNQLCALIYKTSGIHLNQNKRELICSRVGHLLREKNISSYQEFYNLVLKDQSGQLLMCLLDAVSTNETFFFREYDHFEFLKQTIFPELMKDKNKDKNKTISIWSAGCSSGEEPYSLAIVAREFFQQYPGWQINILASDISTKVLAKAESGVFHQDSLKKVPDTILKKYFQYGTSEWQYHVKIKDNIKKMVHFKRLNLIKNLGLSYQFDIIFCRNVMIYFDDITREQIISKFYKQLNSPGYLAIGHSESLINISHQLKYLKPSLYQKK